MHIYTYYPSFSHALSLSSTLFITYTDSPLDIHIAEIPKYMWAGTYGCLLTLTDCKKDTSTSIVPDMRGRVQEGYHLSKETISWLRSLGLDESLPIHAYTNSNLALMWSCLESVFFLLLVWLMVIHSYLLQSSTFIKLLYSVNHVCSHTVTVITAFATIDSVTAVSVGWWDCVSPSSSADNHFPQTRYSHA